MAQKTLNQVLAQRLREVMADKISARALATKAGISPRTVGNYLAPEQAFTAAKGKERSAKLAEIEQLAQALGVPPLSLLMDKDQRADMLRHLATELAAVVSSPPNVPRLPEKKQSGYREISNPYRGGVDRRAIDRRKK